MKERTKSPELRSTIKNNSSIRCPYCHDAVTGSQSKTACDSCMAWHHKECWQELQRCGTCGLTNSIHHAPNPTRTHYHSSRPGSCAYSTCDEPRHEGERGQVHSRYCLKHRFRKARDNAELSNALCGLFIALFFVLFVAASWAMGEPLMTFRNLLLFSFPGLTLLVLVSLFLYNFKTQQKLETLQAQFQSREGAKNTSPDHEERK